jgi:hypothetical protein
MDGTKTDSLLHAGNSLGKARSVFERAIKHRPRSRLNHLATNTGAEPVATVAAGRATAEEISVT